MPSRELPGLGLIGFWDYGSNFKDENDANLRKLSAATQLSVLSRAAAVPGSPTDGDMHLLTDAPNQHAIAVRDNGAWVYLTPVEGWRVFVRDTDRIWYFDGSAWVESAAEHVPITAISGVSATDVQGALAELAGRLDALETP